MKSEKHFATDLTGKVAVITGASRGIGLAIAVVHMVSLPPEAAITELMIGPVGGVL